MTVELETCWLYKCVFVLRTCLLIFFRFWFFESTVFGVFAIPLDSCLNVVGEGFKNLEGIVEGRGERGFLHATELAEGVNCIF